MSLKGEGSNGGVCYKNKTHNIHNLNVILMNTMRERERERNVSLCVVRSLSITPHVNKFIQSLHKWAIAPLYKDTKGYEVKKCSSLTMGKTVKKWVELCLIFITNFYIKVVFGMGESTLILRSVCFSNNVFRKIVYFLESIFWKTISFSSVW